MTKNVFTPGQRVRLLNNDGLSAAVGTIATVGPRGMFTTQPFGNTFVDLIWDRSETAQGNGGYYPNVFELVVDKPKKARKSKPKAENTKIAKLRAHFLSGKSLTQLEAIGLYGAFRLAARVHDLKADGMKIVTRMKEDPNGNPYAEYQLRSPWVKG